MFLFSIDDHFPKLNVAGSIPVSRSRFTKNATLLLADFVRNPKTANLNQRLVAWRPDVQALNAA